jgi:AbrB family looped-hinge helix DNA binding protein
MPIPACPQPPRLETWVRLLSKGLITIPKPMRKTLNLQKGEVVKLRLIGKRLIIEPREVVDYEVYSDEELDQMLKEDKLPKPLAKETESFWSKQS